MQLKKTGSSHKRKSCSFHDITLAKEGSMIKTMTQVGHIKKYYNRVNSNCVKTNWNFTKGVKKHTEGSRNPNSLFKKVYIGQICWIAGSDAKCPKEQNYPARQTEISCNVFPGQHTPGLLSQSRKTQGIGTSGRRCRVYWRVDKYQHRIEVVRWA